MRPLTVLIGFLLTVDRYCPSARGWRAHTDQTARGACGGVVVDFGPGSRTDFHPHNQPQPGADAAGMDRIGTLLTGRARPARRTLKNVVAGASNATESPLQGAVRQKRQWRCRFAPDGRQPSGAGEDTGPGRLRVHPGLSKILTPSAVNAPLEPLNARVVVSSRPVAASVFVRPPFIHQDQQSAGFGNVSPQRLSAQTHPTPDGRGVVTRGKL